MAKIPKHYKLKAEHSQSYEIHDERDKQTFHIAKKDLDLDMHAKLAKIPKFADGTPDGNVGSTADTQAGPYQTSLNDQTSTDVPDYTLNRYEPGNQLLAMLPTSPTPATDSSGNDFTDISGIGRLPDQKQVDQVPNSPLATPNPDSPLIPKVDILPSQSNKPDLALPPQASTSATPVAPGVPTDIMSQFNKNIGAEAAGIQGVANAKTVEGNAAAQVLQDNQAKLQKTMDDAATKRKAIDLENDNLTKAVVDQKIDPQRYMHNMSTGNRIMASIGLFLGGMASGRGGGPNVAATNIQNAINADIDAQKSELGKKQTLLSQNLAKYGDLDHATQVTMMQLNSMAQGQVAILAAKSGAAQAGPAAQAAIANLKNQNMVTGSQLQQSMMSAGVGRQAITSGISAQALPLVPEKQRPNMVLMPNGQYGDAGSAENAKAVNEEVAPYKPLMQDLQQLKQLNTSGSIMSPAGRARADALQGRVVIQLNDLAKARRISEADIGFQKGQLSDPTSIMNKLSGDWNASTDTLMGSLSNRMENTYRTYVPAFSNTAKKVNFTPKGK